MPKNLGESVVDYLLRRKFGALVLSEQRSLRLRGKGGTSEAEHLERELQPLRLYRGELRGKSPAELTALEVQEMASEEAELFGARADLDHWSKMADWTLEQALALSFERNPGVVNWTSVAPHVYWSKFAQGYHRVRERALSHVRWQQLYDPVLPTIFLAWAKRDGFGVSAELVRLVEARGSVVADWKDLYEKMRKNRDELGDALSEVIQERNAAERRANELDAQLRDPLASQAVDASQKGAKPDATTPGERVTLAKLGAYLARRFEFDAAASKNTATGKVGNELAKHGVELDEKTILKLLRSGAERFPTDRK